MQVDVIMRSDFATKDGGDNRQIMEVVEPLRRRGVGLTLHALGTPTSQLRGDLIHLVNVDRPVDFLNTLSQCDRPVVVSSIHHSNDAVASMRRAAAAGGGRARLNALPPAVREVLSFQSRVGLRRDAAGRRNLRAAIQATSHARGLWRRVGRALEGVAAVVVPG